MVLADRPVLVLAPHTDDGEFGCGGTLARLIDEGYRVFYAAFSTASPSLPAHLPPDTLEHEARKATALLGVHELILYDYDVRYFPEHRQPILEDMVKLKTRLNPWLVFVPASTDLHQDHQTIHNEAKRAFKYSNVLGFEQPWNNIVMTTTFFARLETAHIERKITALMAYESQLFRHYHNPEFIRALAVTRGTQVGVKYAEAFEVIRWII
jgi:LmbE family N-acetylglucosaminyl deacetylase